MLRLTRPISTNRLGFAWVLARRTHSVKVLDIQGQGSTYVHPHSREISDVIGNSMCATGVQEKILFLGRKGNERQGLLESIGTVITEQQITHMGTLMVTGLFPYLNTMLRSGQRERELAMARYAAEAGINRVIADMVRGTDAYPTTYTTTQPHTGGSYQTFTITTSYTAANVTVNDYTASVNISLPPPGQTKPSDQQNYVDPGVTHPYLATVQGGEVYLMRLYNVKAGTIQVNWALQPGGYLTNRRLGGNAGRLWHQRSLSAGQAR